MSFADDAAHAARELIALTAISACVWVLFGEGGLSLALIYVMGYVGERLTRFKICCFKLPTLAGMLLAGLALRNVPGPWSDLVSRAPSVWLSALRSIATAVIILRAGMSLDWLKIKADLRGILALGFLPGIFEALVVMLMWKYMLSVSWAWGLMAGFLHAAVSPAVVIPAAIALQEQSLGTKSGVPTRLLSATCIEVVMAIVGFNVCFRIAATPLDPTSVSERDDRLSTPLEVLIGICGGAGAGAFLSFAMPSTAAAAAAGRGLEAAAAESDAAYAVASWVLMGAGIFAVAFFKYLGFPGGGCLVCVMVAWVCGSMWAREERGKAFVIARLNAAWALVQRALFAGMGASQDLWLVKGDEAACALAFLSAGVAARLAVTLLVSRIAGGSKGEPLLYSERIFMAIAWLPKATVQAALGGVAHALMKELHGLYPDDVAIKEALYHASVLQTAGMFALLLTGPLGEALIDAAAPRLLRTEEKHLLRSNCADACEAYASAAAGSAGGAAAEGEEEISFLLLSAAAAAAAGGSRNYAVSCDICGKDMCNKEPKAAKAEVGELNEGRGGGHALKALQELKEKAGKEELKELTEPKALLCRAGEEACREGRPTICAACGEIGVAVVAARVARHRGTGAAAAAAPPRQKCRGVFLALAETRKTDATVFSCEYECGFTGGFEQVSAHESSCKFNPSPTSRTFLPVFNDWQASEGGGPESIHTQHTHVAHLPSPVDGGQRRDVETGGSGQGDESGAGEEVHGGGGGDVLVTMREVLVLNLQESKKRAPLTPTRERERGRGRERERAPTTHVSPSDTSEADTFVC